MAGRQTRGRQRIPISRIQNQDDMYATFSKRRLGLYKKASELSTLCGVDIGIIIFSPTNVPYSFFHPTLESVLNRYRNPNQPHDAYTRAVETTTRSRINALNKRLDEVLEEKQALKEQNKHLDEIERTRQKGWWEETPIESLNMEQVKERIDWFQAFKAQVANRIEQLQNGASTSAPNPQNFTNVAGPSSTPAIGIDQFHGNYNDSIPNLAQDPSYANESSHLSSQYFLPQDPSFYNNYVSHDQSAAGGSGYNININPNSYFSSMSSYEAMDGGSGQVPGHYMYPQPPQDPSSGGGGGGNGQVLAQFFNASSSVDLSNGGHEFPHSQFFVPLNPCTSDLGGGSILGRYGYFHPQSQAQAQAQDPSTAGGSGGASSANHGHGGN